MLPDVSGCLRCAVFSFAGDEHRTIQHPVGVVMWSPARKWVKVRFIEPQQQVSTSSTLEHHPFVDLVHEKVAHWMSTGSLPYSEMTHFPWQDEWWRHVRQLLIHRIQLSEPRPILRDPETSIDDLCSDILRALGSSHA